MECARMLKLGNLTEHLEELLHQAQEKQLTYPEFLLAVSYTHLENVTFLGLYYSDKILNSLFHQSRRIP